MKNQKGKSLKTIKSWAEDDRPREKLLRKGIASLSDAELIAVLIGSGSRDISAVDLSKKILAAARNNLNGEAKAIAIVAALELGRRRRIADVMKRKQVQSSKDAYELLGPVLSDLAHEEFWAVYLSSKNSVIRKEQIGVGGLSSTVSDVRKIMRLGLENHAAAVIVCHNHPSGNLKPSAADKNLTHKLSEAGVIMDISLLDHIIVAGNSYFSFADEGLMK